MPAKKSSTARKTTKRKSPATKSCRPSYKISKAGHLLAVSGDSDSGRVLSREGKKEKSSRRRRGCLSGIKPQGKSFKLSAKQKKKLNPGLQRAILKFHHRGK